MKSRSTLLVFASLLSIGSLASAAPAAPADVPAVPASAVAVASPAPEASPFCAANLAKLGLPGKSELPGLTPPPLFMGPFQTCGACSETICKGAQRGTVCRGGTQIYRCTWVYGDLCTEDNQPDCLCWNGPLP